MPFAGVIVRRDDWLFMLFHTPANLGTRPIADDDKPASAETMMIWRRGEAQHYGNRAERYVHSWLHCNGTDVARMVRSAGLPVHRPFTVRTPAIFQQCLMDIHAELLTRACPDQIIVRNLLDNAVRGLSRELVGPASIPPKEHALIEVRRHISMHYAQPLSLEVLARMANMSVPYFCARFKARFGLSPIACLIC